MEQSFSSIPGLAMPLLCDLESQFPIMKNGIINRAHVPGLGGSNKPINRSLLKEESAGRETGQNYGSWAW